MAPHNPPLEIPKGSGFARKSKFIRYSPVDFFHPSAVCGKSFEVWLGHPYPRLDPPQIHRLTIAYLCENEHTHPNLLDRPPRSIEAAIDLCSYVFSARINARFGHGMETLCASYGEKKKVWYMLYSPSGGTNIEEVRGATLEGWIGIIMAIIRRWS